MSRRLLVLDVFGVLARKVSHDDAISRCSADPSVRVDIGSRERVALVSEWAPWFVRKCQSRYRVGIWSSSEPSTLDPVLRHVFSSGQDPEFVWSREQCDLNPDWPAVKDVRKHDTVKRIERLVYSPVVNRHRDLRRRDVLMCDDSPSKMTFNPPENYVLVWTPPVTQQDFWELYTEIERRLG